MYANILISTYNVNALINVFVVITLMKNLNKSLFKRKETRKSFTYYANVKQGYIFLYKDEKVFVQL